MFKEIVPKIYTSKINSDSIDLYSNNEVIKLLTKKYPNFQIGFIPEKYDVAYMLLDEDLNDSFSDVWKIVFFKKTMNTMSGTITLDNMDALNNSKVEYEIYKILDGSFEDVISTSCELIGKHKSNLI